MSADQRGIITFLRLLATLLLMQPRILLAFAAKAHSWLTVSLLNVYQDSQVHLHRAAPQPVSLQGVIPFQNFARPVEFHMVSVSPFFLSIQVSLHGSSALKHIDCSIQFCVICKLDEHVFLSLKLLPKIFIRKVGYRIGPYGTLFVAGLHIWYTFTTF